MSILKLMEDMLVYCIKRVLQELKAQVNKTRMPVIAA